MQKDDPAEPIDFRTATPEQVDAERDRMRHAGPVQPERNYEDVDWRNLSHEAFREELAKRGVHLRRTGH